MHRHPPIEPYASGWLDVGDGHAIYWEESGNPKGIPALFLHGGPGAFASPNQRRFFDPQRFRIVLLDQRGCGRSKPLGSIEANTTPHLVADIERLRTHLNVERWLIFGVSWGTTLALAYALAHRERVAGLVLGLVATTSTREVKWLTEDLRAVFPEEWHRLASLIPGSLKSLPLIEAYAHMIEGPDAMAAARAWCDWEDTHVSLMPGHQPSPLYQDQDFALRYTRIVSHYWSQAAAFGHDQILPRAHELTGIPGIMIHGRYDISSMMEVPWELSRRWRTSELRVMNDGGHGGSSFVSMSVDAIEEVAAKI